MRVTSFALVSTMLLAPLLAGCAVPAADMPSGSLPPVLALACPDPCEVALDAGAGRAFEPRVAVDPRDPEHLVAVAEEWDPAGNRWIYAYASTDGGATWSKARLPGGPQSGPGPLATCTSQFDPVVAVLDDGTVLAGGGATAELDEGPLYRDLFFARSTDGDLVFEDVVVVTPPEGMVEVAACTPFSGSDPRTKFVDKPWVTALPGGGAFAVWVSGDGPNLDGRATRTGPQTADLRGARVAVYAP